MNELKDTHKKYTRRGPFRLGSVSTLASVCLAVVFCGPTGMFKFQRPPVHGPGVKKPCRYSLSLECPSAFIFHPFDIFSTPCSTSTYVASIRYFLTSNSQWSKNVLGVYVLLLLLLLLFCLISTDLTLTFGQTARKLFFLFFFLRFFLPVFRISADFSKTAQHILTKVSITSLHLQKRTYTLVQPISVNPDLFSFHWTDFNQN